MSLAKQLEVDCIRMVLAESDITDMLLIAATKISRTIIPKGLNDNSGIIVITVSVLEHTNQDFWIALV